MAYVFRRPSRRYLQRRVVRVSGPTTLLLAGQTLASVQIKSTPTLAGSLVGRVEIQASIQSPSALKAALSAKLIAASRDRASITGGVAGALQGRVLAKASTQGGSVGTLPLAATARAGATGKVSNSGATALMARVLVAAQDQGKTAGTLGLSGKTTAQVKVLSTASIVSALTALVGKASIAINLRSNLQGTLGLSGKALAAVQTKGLSKSTIFLAATTAIQTSVRSLAAGTLGLSAKTIAAVQAQPHLNVTYFLAARAFIQAKVQPLASYVANLSTATSVQVSVRSQPNLGSIALQAFGYIQAKLALFFRAAPKPNPNYIATGRARDFIASADPRTIIAYGTPRFFIAIGASNTLAQTNDLIPPIDSSVEVEWVYFDYSQIIDPGVLITAVTSLTCTVNYGSDPAASTRLIGASAIVTSPRSQAPSAAVAQLVGDMVGGVTYLLQCVVATDDGQEISLWTHLACRVPA